MRSLARRLGLSAIAYYNQKLLFVATSTSMSDRPPDVPELPDRRSLSVTLAVSAKQRFQETSGDLRNDSGLWRSLSLLRDAIAFWGFARSAIVLRKNAVAVK